MTKPPLFFLLLLSVICIARIKLVAEREQSLENRVIENNSAYKNDPIKFCQEWWLPDGSNLTGPMADHIQKHIDVIVQSIESYKDLNNETRRIYNSAKNSAWGVITSDKQVDGQFKATYVRGGELPPILLMPLAYSKAVNPNQLFYYDTDTKALYIPCMEIPPAFAAAIFYHEYGHALQHKIDGIETLTVKDLSRVEVPMHTLSIQILKKGVPGYKEKVTEIVTRRKYSSYKEAIAGITKDDLRALDSLVIGDLTRYASVLSYTRTNYWLAVGFEYIDTHSGGEKEKIELHDWLETFAFAK